MSKAGIETVWVLSLTKCCPSVSPGDSGIALILSQWSHASVSIPFLPHNLRCSQSTWLWGRSTWKSCRDIELLVIYLNSLCVCSVAVMSDSLWPFGLQPLSFSVQGTFQARIVGWVAIFFSRGSSWLRNQTWVSYTAGGFFTAEPLGKPMNQVHYI